MDTTASPLCFFKRQRSVHEILGAGLVADVMLWRKKDVTVGILLGTVAAWVVFEGFGYTLLSFVSNILLLLISILFVWAKAAALINRAAPPIPVLHLSEEVINEATTYIHSYVNIVLTAFCDIALGKDSRLFYKVALSLWLISVVSSLNNFLTLGYASLVIVLTVPALYEKYEDRIDRYVLLAYLEVLQYERLYVECFCNAKKWFLEQKRKLS